MPLRLARGAPLERPAHRVEIEGEYLGPRPLEAVSPFGGVRPIARVHRGEARARILRTIAPHEGEHTRLIGIKAYRERSVQGRRHGTIQVVTTGTPLAVCSVSIVPGCSPCRVPSAAYWRTPTVRPPQAVTRSLSEVNDPKGPGDVTPSQGLASDSDTARREPPGAMRAGLTSVGPDIHMAQSTPAGGSKRATDEAGATASTKAPKKSDELLFPTAEERREIDAHNKASGKKTGPAGGVAGAQGSNAAASGPPGQPPAGLGKASDVDPESWAEYGGWYYQDFAIFYRPTGHKDRFVTSWLTLTGPQASNGAASPPAAIFGSLTHKDAQGSCTKCHSVDAAPGKGKRVNFSPVTVEQKTGSFTRFVHEPHFRVVGDRGCVACHELEKGRPYLKSYEQGDPHVFAAQFSDVSKDRCQSCHTSGKARQDCLLCHAYHVNGVITPITDTRLPGP